MQEDEKPCQIHIQISSADWPGILAEALESVVVSEPKRQYLWILSRKPTIETLKYNQLVESLAERNFDMSMFKATPLK